MVDESIWAPVLDAPAEPKEDAISSILGDETTVEVTPGAATTPEASPAAAVTEAAPGEGALEQQATLLQPLLLTWRPTPLLLTWQPIPTDLVAASADAAAGVDADAAPDAPTDSAADVENDLSAKAPANGLLLSLQLQVAGVMHDRLHHAVAPSDLPWLLPYSTWPTSGLPSYEPVRSSRQCHMQLGGVKHQSLQCMGCCRPLCISPLPCLSSAAKLQ